MSFKSELGENIRSARMDSGLKQIIVARRLGVDPATMSRFENGIRMPNAMILRMMSNIFGKSLDDLVPYVMEEEDHPCDGQTTIYDMIGE